MRTAHLSFIILLFFAALFMFSCHENPASRRGLTIAEYQRLKAVGDSVDRQSPVARIMIDSALTHSTDSLTYYDYYIELGRYHLLQHPESVLQCSERILNFAKSQEKTPRVNGLLAEAYHLRANYNYLFHQKSEEVLEDNTKACELFLNSNMKDNAPAVCANIGDVYMQQSLLPQAAAWYRRALVLTDSLQLPEEESYTFYMGLGRIYCILQDYNLSEEYYAKAGKGYDKMPANMKFAFLNNYGNLKYYSRDYSGALTIFTRLDSLITNLGLKGGFEDYLCMINRADVLLNLNRCDESMKCLLPADSFFQANGVGDAIYYANTIRIGNALKKGHMGTVHRILSEEPQALTTDEDMVNIRNRYLQEYFLKTNNVIKANQLQLAYNHRKDSIDQSREHMRSSDIMMRLSLDTLTLHNQLRLNEKNAQISHDRLIFMLVISGVLLVALMLLTWSFYLRRRNADKQLEIINLKISNNRNVIAPHFVFNVLKHASMQQGSESDKTIDGIIQLMRSQLVVSSQLFVTLREELDFTQNYVNLAAESLTDKFVFEVQCPDKEAMDIRNVPSTFVQILAENAIKHALALVEGEKRLIVNVLITDEDTLVMVEDNGPGFDIRRNSDGTGTGLKVIQRTIALYNQSHRHKMAFKIENINGQHGKPVGCKATLTIPYDAGK